MTGVLDCSKKIVPPQLWSVTAHLHLRIADGCDCAPLEVILDKGALITYSQTISLTLPAREKK